MADAAPNPIEIGRYRVERVLGRGAMGVIYQAHDPIIDRKVAIKLIRADLLGGEEHEEYLARFRREAQAVGRCTHPNIVGLYDCSVHDGNPYLAMEFVDGSNLGEVLTQSGRMPLTQALAVIDQVLSALACAHGLGIVHRDVKPANILLQADGRVKMTDFGIARFDGSDLTQGDLLIGTPSYMSPEQIRGEVVDARSDLFSTGVVLYQMLSGERPFPGRNVSEITLRLIQAPAPDIRAKQPDIPAGIAATINRALAKQPGDRFASAEEMAEALRQGLQEPDATVVLQRAPEQAAISTDLVQSAERRLTQHIGPIARILVRRALGTSQSPDEFLQTLATHIDRDADREEFLADRPY